MEGTDRERKKGKTGILTHVGKEGGMHYLSDLRKKETQG